MLPELACLSASAVLHHCLGAGHGKGSLRANAVGASETESEIVNYAPTIGELRGFVMTVMTHGRLAAIDF